MSPDVPSVKVRLLVTYKFELELAIRGKKKRKQKERQKYNAMKTKYSCKQFMATITYENVKKPKQTKTKMSRKRTNEQTNKKQYEENVVS